jgi:hypothetical protein
MYLQMYIPLGSLKRERKIRKSGGGSNVKLLVIYFRQHDLFIQIHCTLIIYHLFRPLGHHQESAFTVGILLTPYIAQCLQWVYFALPF